VRFHSVPRPAGMSRPCDLTPSRARRILIAEDESLMRHFIDEVLRSAGYSTARVVDGQEALEFSAAVSPFELLLTDLVMPRMYGTELAQRLREKHPAMKVLYFTGFRDQLFIEKRQLLEGEGFLEKPSTVEGLLDAVSLLLDGRVARRLETGTNRRRH
jgi:CheY-like chemotaxis protein